MPSRRIAAARTEGICPNDFAHDRRIRTGDRVITTTYFTSDEHVRFFAVAPFTRVRVCLFCTASKIREYARLGTLGFVAGLRPADVTAAGAVTEDVAELVA